MKKRTLSTKYIVMTGMFAAVLAVLSQIAIPMPSGIPVTLQTFAVALTGCVLSWKMGGLAVLIYLLLGAAGMPVFSGFKAGPGILFGATGGFLFGFLFMVFFSGLASVQKNKVIRIFLAGAGLAICHLLGILQFSLVSGRTFAEAAMLSSVPYLLKDAVSVILAFVSGWGLKKALCAANVLSYDEV